MDYPDQYHLTPDQNRRFARANLTRLVYTNSRFEGLTTTLPQTQTIIDGMGVAGVSVEDINTIVQLKRGWEEVIGNPAPLTLDRERAINRIVARDDSLAPGEFRTGNGLAATNQGDFVPDLVDQPAETDYLAALLTDDSRSITARAIELLYHNMRQQLFWDGNKRTATLVANQLMIDHGAGLINVPLDLWGTWNDLIAAYYRSNDLAQLMAWTYRFAIQGVTL